MEKKLIFKVAQMQKWMALLERDGKTDKTSKPWPPEKILYLGGKFVFTKKKSNKKLWKKTKKKLIKKQEKNPSFFVWKNWKKSSYKKATFL